MKKYYLIVELFVFGVMSHAQTNHWELLVPELSSKALTFYISKNELLIGTARNGVCYSNDSGKQWTYLTQGLRNGRLTAILNCSENILLAGTSFSGHVILENDSIGIFRSTDNGVSWELKQKTIWVNSIIKLTDSVFIASTNTFNLVRKTYKTSDKGETWHEIGQGLPERLITQIIKGPQDYLFAINFAGGIYISDNSGDSWELLDASTLTLKEIDCLRFNSKGTLFVGVYFKGIYRSTDDGKSWVKTNYDEKVHINDMAIDRNGHIFVGTWKNGILVSKDDGASWKTLNLGLNELSISSLAIDSNNVLYAGTVKFSPENESDAWLYGEVDGYSIYRIKLE